MSSFFVFIPLYPHGVPRNCLAVRLYIPFS